MRERVAISPHKYPQNVLKNAHFTTAGTLVLANEINMT